MQYLPSPSSAAFEEAEVRHDTWFVVWDEEDTEWEQRHGAALLREEADTEEQLEVAREMNARVIAVGKNQKWIQVGHWTEQLPTVLEELKVRLLNQKSRTERQKRHHCMIKPDECIVLVGREQQQEYPAQDWAIAFVEESAVTKVPMGHQEVRQQS